MTPLFFGTSDEPLFGIYHEGSSFKETAILMCYPTGYEYMRVHRAYRVLAERLCREGFPVLRFDYFATGDSAGNKDQGSIKRWKEDVRTAAQELEDMSGAMNICVLGLRMGAVLACCAGDDGIEINQLVLWDPVVNGKDYIRELEALDQQRRASFGNVKELQSCRDRAVPELIGYPLSRQQRTEIEEICLATQTITTSRGAVIVESDHNLAYAELQSAFARSNVRLDHRTSIGASDWMRVDGRARVAKDALDTVADALIGENR